MLAQALTLSAYPTTKKKQIWRGYKHIGARLGCTRDNARKVMRKLVAAGILVKVYEGGRGKEIPVNRWRWRPAVLRALRALACKRPAKKWTPLLASVPEAYSRSNSQPNASDARAAVTAKSVTARRQAEPVERPPGIYLAFSADEPELLRLLELSKGEVPGRTVGRLYFKARRRGATGAQILAAYLAHRENRRLCGLPHRRLDNFLRARWQWREWLTTPGLGESLEAFKARSGIKPPSTRQAFVGESADALKRRMTSETPVPAAPSPDALRVIELRRRLGLAA